MDLRKAAELLGTAEVEIRAQIGRGDPGDSYELLSSLLELGKRVRSLRDEVLTLGQLESTDIQSVEPQMLEPGEPSGAESSEFPLYFIDEDTLYKVGEATDGHKVYVKRVTLDDASQVVATIQKFYGESEQGFTINGLMSENPGPAKSKVQVLVMALVEATLIERRGRGEYTLSGSLRRWRYHLDQLPKHPEMLAKDFVLDKA
ncbi:hypothetical protein J2S49_001268 [Arcanobacterium wilhelmae]|uniref:Uncharacterized protein n=1 Tax=Arcanobacterium wilhelmae TaxID=1803177 RepID=A0ABT9NBU5_9ACTO|nr:hypothetical protein [Arcanobacterium wilhelmae]MDP9801192.1 hypothetical protein [Arcanobacterium wilhelmae]WFN90544.1 hypothetical protein P8A24_01395 [Arcanobacterium wilhelmae]